MPVIDKKMYEKLKSWCDWEEEKRPCNQQIMYVNSHDRELTNATIRKMMFEMRKEDIHGELYMAFFSAKNFYRNMRDYYSHIADLYRRSPSEDDSIVDIIKTYPPTCGWIVLIVEDIELLSGKAEEMQMMMESIFAFSSRNPSIILVGDGDYKKVFDGCEFAINEMNDGIAAKEDDDLVMVGCYDQDLNPQEEKVIYENTDEQRKELNFYWETLYEQLKKRYFDYSDFKRLYKDTFEFIIPRVTVEQVYRKDISLVENIGAIGKENNKLLDGCAPWEFDAAQEFSTGLHMAIINKYGYHDDMSGEKIGIDVIINEADEDCGAIYISGYTFTEVEIDRDTVFSEMDKLSDTICECTYKGDSARLWRFLNEKYAEKNGLEAVPKAMEEVEDKLTSLMDDIKEVADKTVNIEPGRKVRRFKENSGDNT